MGTPNAPNSRPIDKASGDSAAPADRNQVYTIVATPRKELTGERFENDNLPLGVLKERLQHGPISPAPVDPVAPFDKTTMKTPHGKSRKLAPISEAAEKSAHKSSASSPASTMQIPAFDFDFAPSATLSPGPVHAEETSGVERADSTVDMKTMLAAAPDAGRASEEAAHSTSLCEAFLEQQPPAATEPIPDDSSRSKYHSETQSYHMESQNSHFETQVYSCGRPLFKPPPPRPTRKAPTLIDRVDGIPVPETNPNEPSRPVADDEARLNIDSANKEAVVAKGTSGWLKRVKSIRAIKKLF